MTTASPKWADIHDRVSAYYSGKLEAFGATAQGVDWRDEDSQRLRHQQFLRLFAGDTRASISDVGCGYGDFLNYLRAHGYTGHFAGYDLSRDMIAAAQQLHRATADCSWTVGACPTARTAYVIASGIFNVRQQVPEPEWKDYVDYTVDKMAESAETGFGFNLLSKHSDPERRRNHLYYADPISMLDHIVRRYGRHVALLQDYGLFEFTILVRHR